MPRPRVHNISQWQSQQKKGDGYTSWSIHGISTLNVLKETISGYALFAKFHISLQGIADFAIGKFRVTSLRESVIDFSSPFMYEPAGMAMRRPHRGGYVSFRSHSVPIRV